MECQLAQGGVGRVSWSIGWGSPGLPGAKESEPHQRAPTCPSPIHLTGGEIEASRWAQTASVWPPVSLRESQRSRLEGLESPGPVLVSPTGERLGEGQGQPKPLSPWGEDPNQNLGTLGLAEDPIHLLHRWRWETRPASGQNVLLASNTKAHLTFPSHLPLAGTVEQPHSKSECLP